MEWNSSNIPLAPSLSQHVFFFFFFLSTSTSRLLNYPHRQNNLRHVCGVISTVQGDEHSLGSSTCDEQWKQQLPPNTPMLLFFLSNHTWSHICLVAICLFPPWLLARHCVSWHVFVTSCKSVEWRKNHQQACVSQSEMKYKQNGYLVLKPIAQFLHISFVWNINGQQKKNTLKE